MSRKKVKLTIIGTLVLTFTCHSPMLHAEAKTYPDAGMVYKVKAVSDSKGDSRKKPDNESEDTYKIFVQMQNGNRFSFYTKDVDWFVGDLAALTMEDKDTPLVKDDLILDAKYCGWISEEEQKRWVK